MKRRHKMKNVWYVFLVTVWGACSAMAEQLPSAQDMASSHNAEESIPMISTQEADIHSPQPEIL